MSWGFPQGRAGTSCAEGLASESLCSTGVTPAEHSHTYVSGPAGRCIWISYLSHVFVPGHSGRVWTVSFVRHTKGPTDAGVMACSKAGHEYTGGKGLLRLEHSGRGSTFLWALFDGRADLRSSRAARGGRYRAP
jgi:hypothetical protein